MNSREDTTKIDEGYRLSASQENSLARGDTDIELDFPNKILIDKDIVQISCQKSRLIKAITGIVVLLITAYLLNQVRKYMNRSRFPMTHEFHEVHFKDDGHLPSFQHLHQPLKFDYPTVGIPVPGNYFNSTRVPEKYLYQFDKVILDSFKPYNDTDCQLKRYGDEADGGYVICDNFIDHSEAILNLGIHGFDNFGCDITTAYPVPNYQFDCTDEHHPVCKTNKNNNFYEDVCIGEITQKKNLQYWSLEDMIKKKNLTNKHIMLKIDIDGGQYLAFRYLPVEYLDNIDQIFMESHFDFLGREQWGYLDIYKTLAEKFVNVNFNNNNNGCFQAYKPIKPERGLKSHAFQVSLVNRKLIKIKSPTRSWAMSPLNALNNPLMPDCQQTD